MKFKPVREQVIVVVGANSGIGKVTALQAAAMGATVVAAGRSREALDEVVEQIHSMGGQAIAAEVDVSDFDQVKALADQAVTAFGRIDTWVHLAAVPLYASFDETQPEEFKRVVEVNLLGQVYGAMAALPHLKKEGRGALIHISSVTARQSIPYQSAYSASKQGMVGFLNTLRMELKHDGYNINVANIMPASVNTPFFSKAATRMGVKPEPLPPVYQPELVADAIMYAATHPARDIIVGDAGRGLSLIRRISPRLGDRMLQNQAFRLQRSDIPKSSEAPNNLYGHLEGYDRVHGEYSDQARRGSLGTWMATHPLARVALTLVALGAGLFFVSRTAIPAIRNGRNTRMHRIVQAVKNSRFLPGRRPRTIADRLQRIAPARLVRKKSRLQKVIDALPLVGSNGSRIRLPFTRHRRRFSPGRILARG